MDVKTGEIKERDEDFDYMNFEIELKENSYVEAKAN